MSMLPSVAAALFAPPAAASPPPQAHTATDWHADFGGRMQLPYSHTVKAASASRADLRMPAPTSSASAPDAAYPRLEPIWARIRSWSRRHFPEVADTLNPPASPAAVRQFERLLRQPLPPAVKESFALVNGQDNESLADGALARARVGLVLGLPLLSVEEAMAEWTYWRHVDSDPASGANEEVRANMASCPDGWVAAQYSHPGWVPLVSDRMGNYIGVDLSPPRPGPETAAGAGCGQAGQVILFGRDFDTTIVLHPGDGKGGWAHFLSYLADTLESGTFFTLSDDPDEASDEEDYIGYEGYFGGSTGASAVGGGPASAHLGGYGFRLRKPYKGVSVLQALADKSATHWEQLGYLRGMSPAEAAWRQAQAVTAVSGDETPFMPAEHQEQILYDPLDDVRHPAAPAVLSSPPGRWTELEHPLSPLSETGMSTGSSFSTDSGIRTPRRRAPPPQSSDLLAVPTWEDVQAEREDELQRTLGKEHTDTAPTTLRNRLFSFTLPWRTKSTDDVEASLSSDSPRTWSFFPRSFSARTTQEIDLGPGLASSHA